MEPVSVADDECSQNVVAEVSGFEPPFTQSPVTPTTKKYGPNSVQTQIKTVRRVRKVSSAKGSTSQVNGVTSRTIHEISSDEEQFFKQPVSKNKKLSSEINDKATHKVVEKTSATIWEEKCTNLGSFLPENSADHD